MTFLQLCKRVMDLSKKSDTSKVTGLPVTTQNQTGDIARLVEFVAQAWVEIQKIHDEWNFLWAESDGLNMVAGTKSYAKATGCNQVITDSVNIEANGGLVRCKHIDFQAFRKSYGRSYVTSGVPNSFTIRPDGMLQFFPIPDGAYQYHYDFYRSPQVMAADDDVPLVDEKYHMAIVYLALALYGEYLKDADLVAIGEKESSPILTQMSNELLPSISMAEPLV